MGADLIVAVVAIRQGTEPDFEAGERWIAGLSAAELKQVEDTNFGYCAFDGEPEPAAVRQALTDLLKEFREAVTGNWRDVTTFPFGEWKVMLTGGMSWGDTPSDAFDPLNDAQETGLAEACGFGWPEKYEPSHE